MALITRRGKKKALVAIAHHLMVATYFVIKNKESYKEPVLHDNPKRKSRQIKNHLAKLKELGVEIELNLMDQKNQGRVLTGEPMMAARKRN